MVTRQFYALLIIAVALCAQPKDGDLIGRIIDRAGAGLANVTIILKDDTGKMSREITTDKDGSFAIRQLLFGSYQVEMSAPGGRRSASMPLRVDATSTETITLTFQDTPAGTSAPSEVAASSPMVQTTSAEVARSYETLLIRQLPLEDRQAQELIGLMPGLSVPVTSPDRVMDPQRRRILHVNGLPDWANAFHQDGIYQNEPGTNNAVRIAPNASIQSLNVRTSNYNAEHGFSGGGWVNTVTRPGQNQVHGSVFGFHANDDFQSRNPLNNQGSAENPRFNRNQFGASLGAPVAANSMFLFGAYEGYLRRGNSFNLATVPTADLRSGDFSGFSQPIYDPASGTAAGMGRIPFPGNQIPISQQSPFALGLLDRLPAANRSGFANNLAGAALLREDNHRGDIKLDHRLTEDAYGFFRYGFTQASVERGSLLGSIGDQARSSLRNHSAAAGFSYSFTPTVTGEIRLGYSRYRNLISPLSMDTGFSDLLNEFGYSNGLPSIQIGALSSLGQPAGYFNKPVSNTFDGATNWGWHTNRHDLKFGVLGRVIRASGFVDPAFGANGAFTFGTGPTSLPGGVAGNPIANSFASFLLGAPTQSGAFAFSTTPTIQQEHYSAYVTDTVNIMSRVYLELGLRYDIFSPLRTRFTGSNQVFDPNLGSVSNATANALYDLNNFAPRVGLAIRPIDRMTVRFGYGLHYFPIPMAYSGLNQAAMGIQSGISGGYGRVPFTVPQVPSNMAGMAPNIPYTVANRDRQTPYVQTYSAIIQGDLGAGLLMDIGYVGNRGRQLPLLWEQNAALPGTGLAGLPFAAMGRTASTTSLSSGLNSSFNSLQVNLTKRFAKSFSFTGAYTYGKVLDYGSQLAIPFNRADNYGPADWDRTHILAVSHLWRLPFGASRRYAVGGVWGAIFGDWELNGILRWATGTPYNVLGDPLLCACPGINNVRLGASGGGDFDGSTSFDSSRFSIPSGQISNVARNAIRGPEFFVYNAALFKNFAVTENFKLELRGEAYNLTNAANYANPVSSALTAGFGSSNRLLNDVAGRHFQVAARLLF